MVIKTPIMSHLYSTKKERTPFSDNLQMLREKKGKTQEQMSDAIDGIGFEAYRRYEYGESQPKFYTLIKICEILQCTPDTLFGYINMPNHDMQFIHDETGLSEKAIKRLCTWVSGDISERGDSSKLLLILSNLLEDDRFEDLLFSLLNANQKITSIYDYNENFRKYNPDTPNYIGLKDDYQNAVWAELRKSASKTDSIVESIITNRELLIGDENNGKHQ